MAQCDRLIVDQMQVMLSCPQVRYKPSFCSINCILLFYSFPDHEVAYVDEQYLIVRNELSDPCSAGISLFSCRLSRAPSAELGTIYYSLCKYGLSQQNMGD